MITLIYNTQHGLRFKHTDLKEVKKMYLDYVNNFLTIGAFAEHYGLTYVSAKRVIKIGGIK